MPKKRHKPEEIVAQSPAIQATLVETEKATSLRDRRNMLLRLLQRRFGAVSEHITQTIEDTIDLDQLDAWLDQLLDAQSLAEIDFPSESVKM